MRHAALRMLYEKLDPYESDRGVPVVEVIAQMARDPLLRSLLDEPENGADLMHTRMPRSVLAALTQWSLSGDSHISWRQLLPLFMDPHSNPDGGEPTGTLSMASHALRRSIGMPSPRGGDGTRGAATRHRSSLRKSRGAPFASSSSEDEEEASDLSTPMREPHPRPGEASGEAALSRPSPSMRGRASKVAFDMDDAASKVVELTRTPLGLGLTVDSQLTILAVTPDSQAARSGSFAVNDRLVSLNGQALGGGASLEQLLRAFAVGTKVAVEVRKAPSSRAPPAPAAPRATSMDARFSKAKGKHPVPY